jgi:hypothetical protein
LAARIAACRSGGKAFFESAPSRSLKSTSGKI